MASSTQMPSDLLISVFKRRSKTLRYVWTAFALLFILFVSSSSRAAVVYVNANAAGPAHDGGSWETAFLTVREGLGAAQLNDEVCVGAGTYVENVTLQQPVVSLLGGFAGKGTDPGRRNPVAYPTILDGGKRGSVITVPSEVYVGIVDGFTLRNGTGTVPPGTATSYGGAVFALGDITLRNDILEGNSARFGGAIYTTGGLLAISCIFRDNHASDADPVYALAYGGAVHCMGGVCRVVNSTFVDNAACVSGQRRGDAVGGALYAYDTDVTLRENVFARNSVTASETLRQTALGPGIYVEGGMLSCVNNTLAGHTQGVGALYLSGSLVSTGTTYQVVNNIVANNASGIVSATGAPTVRKNCFFANPQGDTIGNAAGAGTNGNIGGNPRFVNPSAGDYHLMLESPCINTGDSSVVNPGETDNDGDPRIINGKVDIGADEWQLPVSVGPRLYVRTDGDDTNDGLSWGRAKATLQAATDIIAPNGEIWVAGGAYPGPCILRRYNVTLLGAFAGTESSASQRQRDLHPTSIAGIAVAGTIVGTIVDAFTMKSASCGGESSLTMSHVAVIGPGAGMNGSSLVSTGGGSALTMTDSVVTGGRIGPFGGFGAGINGGGDLTLERCTIAGNGVFGDDAPAEGGGIAWGGGAVTIRNCLIAGNGVVADNASHQFANPWAFGGGAVIYGGRLNIVNNTIVNSFVGGDHGAYGEGAALCLQECTGTLANNIIAYNTVFPGGAAVFTVLSTLDASNNLLYANQTSDGIDPQGTRNTRADPLFVRSRADYHLLAGSPAIDAGIDSLVTLGERDRDGWPRNQGAHTDIGAYEYASGTAITIADVSQALRVAGGLSTMSSMDAARLGAAPARGLGVLDAIRLLRIAMGLTVPA